MEKIDFALATKEMPVTAKELAYKISNTPHDIILEYIVGMEELKKQYSKITAIFHAIDGAFFQDLIDELNETELNGVNRVVDILNDRDVLNKIDELIRASTNFDSRPDNSLKSIELLDIIKNLGEECLKKLAGKIISYSFSMNKLSRFLLFYFEKKWNEDAVLRHLRTIDEQDIELMIGDIHIFMNVFKEYTA